MLLLSLITNAFVVVSGLAWKSNGMHTLNTIRTRQRKSLSRSTSTPFDCSSSCRPSKIELGLSKTDEKERSIFTDEIDSGYNRGLLVLATVPVAWGTFEPAVRLVYKYEPLMPPLVFSFAYYLVATSVLTVGTLYSLALSPPASTLVVSSGDNRDEESSSRAKDKETGFFSGLSLSTRGGIELGTYLFIGNAFQVIGLKTVPSDRAAFLLQLTTIFVPLLKSVKEESSIPRQTWVACLVALMGVALIGLDGGDRLSYNILDTIRSYNDSLNQSSHLLDRLPAFSVDDGYIILAAVFYTFHCVRLETYARSTVSAIELATAKATTEMIWSGFVILGCIFAAEALSDAPAVVDLARVSGEKIVTYGEGIQEQISSWLFFGSSGWPMVGLSIFWIGTVTVAYTIYAQSFGQSKVSAITANLIYSSQPISTAMVAYFLLGESLGPNGYIGGMFIGVAVLLVIVAETETEEKQIMTKAKK